MNTNLIENYVSEVGRRLPGRTRKDIEAEIRSILQDMLDERSQKTGKPVNEEMTLEVLKAYGTPEKVAATYQGERYMIGPRLYPTFLLVLRIVLVVIGVLAAIGLGIAISHTQNPQDAVEAVLTAIGNFITSVLIAFGNIVIIFAIIEWALYRAGSKADLKGLPKEKEWDPRSLLKASPSNLVKMGETILEMVGAFVAIIIFNFYPQIIGFGIFSNGNWYVGAGTANSSLLLSQAFLHFVPYLTLVWVLTILLDIVLLRLGHWNVLTHLSQIALKIINIVIAAAMLGVPSLLAITTTSLTPAVGNVEAALSLITLLNLFVRIALWLSIFGNIVEIVRAISRLVVNETVPQFSGKS
ncbi:MAG: hypothetical protein ABSA01_01945 [Anaerolineales bacterium]